MSFLKYSNKFIRENRLPIFLFSAYIILLLFVFRTDFGNSANFPMGTNALDTYISNYSLKRFGIISWYPLTDWGQPVINVSTLLDPFILLVPETIFIRSLEFICFALSYVSMYIFSYHLTKSKLGAFVASVFYSLGVETSQFFEGHLGLMISFALFPLIILSIYSTVKKPNLKNAIILGILAYLLFSIGDIGGFYMIAIIALFEIIVLEAFNIMKRVKLVASLKYLTVGAFIFILTNFAWLFTYLSGNRPQFTTNITVKISPFSQVSGVPIKLGITGFIADNTFTTIALHNIDYSFLSGNFYLLFFTIPAIVVIYGYFTKNKRLKLFILTALVSILISTGSQYPGISQFNYVLYTYFPLFNYIPALYRWNFYTDFVYATVFAFLVGDLTRKYSLRESLNLKLLINKRVRKSPPDGHRLSKILVALLVIALILLPFCQNSEVMSSPPTTFEFPSDHTSAYIDLYGNSDSNILTIPFGAIYSRTPWSGVSQSSIFMSPYFSGHNSIMFQAGDPYSLAMDNFIGNGITYGLTNNITKFLSATNTKYVVTTHYSNWSRSSDAIYDPPNNYNGYMNQTSKGEIIYSTANQTTFMLNNSGQIYYSPTYFVYFGGSSLLYEILNQPWYNGTSTPLINGSAISGKLLDIVLSHSSALIVSPLTINDLTPYQNTLQKFNIPVYVIYNYKDFPGADIKSSYTPWEASNANSFNIVNGASLSLNNSIIGNLVDLGYNNVTTSIRANTGQFYTLMLSNGNGTSKYIVSPSPVMENVSNISWKSSLVSAGINNQNRYSYDGNTSIIKVDNITYRVWNFSPYNDTFQYLNFPFGNVLDHEYLHFIQKGTQLLNYLFQAILVNNNGTQVDFNAESISSVNNSENITNVYFDLSGLDAYISELNENLTVQRFVIGFPSTLNFTQEELRNFDLFNTTTYNSSFVNYAFGNDQLNLTTRTLNITASSNIAINTITLAFTKNGYIPHHAASTPVRVRSYNPTSYDISVPQNANGILVFTQTYSQLWNLTLNNIAHVPVDIGLNGWLLTNETHNGTNVSINYLGQKFLVKGEIIQYSAEVTFTILMAIYLMIRKKALAIT
ncbi:MAG: hypothetical protein QXU18_04170 [Thermoplasmatales archaeon]